jgi:hypothetical protein
VCVCVCVHKVLDDSENPAGIPLESVSVEESNWKLFDEEQECIAFREGIEPLFVAFVQRYPNDWDRITRNAKSAGASA